MKKKAVLLLSCSILLALEGCEKKEDIKTEVVNIYKLNPDNGVYITEAKECQTLNETVLWELLKENEIVPTDSEILSFQVSGDKLELDTDTVFGDWLRSFGTAGEREIVGCIVNTYLDAYKAEEIKITEEGQTLTTGHAEYAEYLRKFE